MREPVRGKRERGLQADNFNGSRDDIRIGSLFLFPLSKNLKKKKKKKNTCAKAIRAVFPIDRIFEAFFRAPFAKPMARIA